MFSSTSKRELYLRFAVLERYNELYSDVFPLIDLTEYHIDSLPSRIFARRNLQNLYNKGFKTEKLRRFLYDTDSIEFLRNNIHYFQSVLLFLDV